MHVDLQNDGDRIVVLLLLASAAVGVLLLLAAILLLRFVKHRRDHEKEQRSTPKQ